MICPNKNTKEWKNLVEIQGESEAYLLWTAYQGNVPEQFYSRTKPVTTTQTTIKPGVPELFESNPELANNVYKALGFKTKEFVEEYYSDLLQEIKDFEFEYDDRGRTLNQEAYNNLIKRKDKAFQDITYNQKYEQQKQEAQIKFQEYINATGRQDIEGFKEFVQGRSNNIKPGVSELFESNPELANAVYEALGLNNINESEITYTDEDGNPCAKMGGRSPKFTKGSQWEIVKDLKGYPTHKEGGVDLTISKNGVSIKNGNTEFIAQHGLVLPNNFGNPLEFEAMSKVLTQRNKHLNWVDRGLNPDKYPKIDNQDGTFSTHRLAYSTGDNGEAYVYPTIIQNDKGELEQLDDNAAWEYAKKTKTAMRIPNVKLAEYYSQNGLIKH